MLCLIAEPLRNLGRYTFADVVAFRLQQRPVRVASAVGGLAVIAFYLIAQMVGAGNLIRLLFGLSYEVAVVIVGVVMLAYVLFGGMLATTWVQIVKAVLLMAGAALLALLVLMRYSLNPLALFADAASRYGDAVLAPGRLVSDPIDAISLGIALMFGTAGLPHILMRFYTVPDARTARVSVAYATAAIGVFYLFTFILGFGAMVIVGQDAIRAIDAGGNMAAPLLAEAVGGQAFLGFIAAVAFATILAVVAGLTLAGAAALSHDIWVNVVRDGHADSGEQLRVARGATILLAIVSIVLGIAFKGQNVAYMVGLAFAIAASANFPALVLSMFWKPFTTMGAVASIVVGHGDGARAHLPVADHPDRPAQASGGARSRSATPASSRFRCPSPSASSCRCWRRKGRRRRSSPPPSGGCTWAKRLASRRARRVDLRMDTATRPSHTAARARELLVLASILAIGSLGDRTRRCRDQPRRPRRRLRAAPRYRLRRTSTRSRTSGTPAATIGWRRSRPSTPNRSGCCPGPTPSSTRPSTRRSSRCYWPRSHASPIRWPT